MKIIGNDGKELKEGQDIHITMRDGKISVDVLNPKRGKSGNYKVLSHLDFHYFHFQSFQHCPHLFSFLLFHPPVLSGGCWQRPRNLRD